MTPAPSHSRAQMRAAVRHIDRAVHALETAEVLPTPSSGLSASHAFDRRRFLSLSASTLAAAMLTGCGLAGNDRAERVLAYAARKNETVERFIMRHTAIDRGSPGAVIAGGRFPSYHIADTLPVWNAESRGEWKLEVSGLVTTPLSLTLPALMALRQANQRVDHFCVEGWNAVARFTGVRMTDIAKLAGALPTAKYVDFRSFDDGYHESWDIESAMHPQTLVVYGKDGQLLSAMYGAPARLHSPIKLGYKNTKYLTQIVFMDQRNGGYWTDNGYEWYGGT